MKESRTLVVDCFICEVAAGRRRASVVLDDAGIVAFADLRQRGEAAGQKFPPRRSFAAANPALDRIAERVRAALP